MTRIVFAAVQLKSGQKDQGLWIWRNVWTSAFVLLLINRGKKENKWMCHSDVKRTCISRVCCYILTGTKQTKMWTKKGKKNPANEKTWEMGEVEVTLFFFFLNTSLSLTSNAIWTAGYMDTLHMHTHMTEVINQNDKGTDFTSCDKSEQEVFF